MEALFSSTAAMAFRPKGNTVVSMHLFAIAVALAPGARPPGDAIKASLERSRMFTGARIRIANGWCSPKDIAALKPVAARSVLLDIAAGRAPAATLLRDAPPAGDFAVLLAVEMTTVDEATPLCVLMDHGANMQDAYEEWRDALVKDVRGIEDALCPCMPSALAAEIDINEFEAMPADSVADLDADDDGMEIPGSRPMAPANDQAKPRYLH
jgi:hypothetical protein